MSRFVLGAMLLFAPAAATAQQPAPQSEQGQRELWRQSETRILSVSAGTAFPRVAGPVSFTGTREFSNEGEGIDAALQYRSADGKVIGTVYVYLAGLSHAGLAAYATDQAIRANSQSPVRALRTSVVTAGTVERAAIRTDYENYMDGNASSAAFIKAGRWTIKIRVTAPQARSSDVASAMDALLRGIEFGRANPPRPAVPIASSDCPAGDGQLDAKPLPEAVGADVAARGMIATFDGGGVEASDKSGARSDLPSRVPAGLCLSSRIPVGKGETPILRGPDGPAISVDGRTVLIALISDSGIWVEVVHAPNLGGYLVLHHQIGWTYLLGSYDAVPSDRQIADLLSNPASDAGRIRVSVKFRPGEAPRMLLPPAETPKLPTT